MRPLIKLFSGSIIVFALILTTVIYIHGNNDSNIPRHTSEPPEIYVPMDLFPSNGEYESTAGSSVNWPVGVYLRYLGNRDFSQYDTLPDLGAGWKTYNFNSTMACEISFNSGSSWSLGIANAYNSVRLNHVADTGLTRYFDAEIIGLNISGGMLPGNVIFRESPTLPSTGKVRITDISSGYMIDSFFDIWFEVSLDGGGSWLPAPNEITIEFSYYPADYYFITNLFPPQGSYTSKSGDSAVFSLGIMVRNMVKRNPDASAPPPPPGPPSIYPYNDDILLQLSLDNGETWLDISAPCANITQLTHKATDGSTDIFAAEYLNLTISGGNLPSGVLLRENPTLSSTGQYTTTTSSPGSQISSYFDVFLEISVDAGMNWLPANNSIKLELFACPVITIDPPELPFARAGHEYSKSLSASGGTPPYTFAVESGLLPPDMNLTADGILSGTPSTYGYYTFTILAEDQFECQGSQTYNMTVFSNEHFCRSDVYPPYGRYLSKQDDLLKFPAGIVVKNIVHHSFRPFGALPSLGSQDSYSFEGSIGFEFSLDQGGTYSHIEAPTTNTVTVDHTADSSGEYFFDIEIIQMDITGGALPPGVLIRENPTQISSGKLKLLPHSDDFCIDSFFDIFTELSFDGGFSWFPAMNEALMELHYISPTLTNTDYYPPDGIYKSSENLEFYWANGTAVRNLELYNLLPQDSPPSLDDSRIFNFAGLINFELSLDDGLSWTRMQASTTNSSVLGHFEDDGTMNFYDSEMLQFDIAGGTLPPGVIIRESPTLISAGEHNTKIRTADSWWVESFFDIFFEMSTDGGYSWSPPLQPVELVLSISNLRFEINNNWNMISLPMIVTDPRKTVLFPTATSPAYTFEGTYTEKESLANGNGYWLKFGSSETASMRGIALTEDTLDVVEGWNLIGSISVPVGIKNILSDPEGIITSEVFGYTTAYNPVDTLQPGKAYWVKVAGAARLILSITGGEMRASSKIKIVPTSELPPSPPADEVNNILQVPIPAKVILHQNTPNPFNPSTIISYELIKKAKVTLKVFNLFGQEVATLVDEIQTPGHKSVLLNADNIASGVYFYRLSADNFAETKKMLFCK